VRALELAAKHFPDFGGGHAKPDRSGTFMTVYFEFHLRRDRPSNFLLSGLL